MAGLLAGGVEESRTCHLRRAAGGLRFAGHNGRIQFENLHDASLVPVVVFFFVVVVFVVVVFVVFFFVVFFFFVFVPVLVLVVVVLVLVVVLVVVGFVVVGFVNVGRLGRLGWLLVPSFSFRGVYGHAFFLPSFRSSRGFRAGPESF
jgi:hypothetical protein